MKQSLINFYGDWRDNYPTIQHMADAYGIDKDDCLTLIDIGRKLHDAEVQRLKEKSAPKLSSNPYKGMGLDDILGHMAKQVTDILSK